MTAKTSPSRQERSWPLLSYVCALLAISGAGCNHGNQNTLSLRCLKTVDDRGTARLALVAPLPDPDVRGKTYKRSRDVYGLQLRDPDGNEVGGLGVMDGDNGARVLCFDHETAEATCLIGHRQYTGLNILQQPPPDAKVGRPGPQRIAISIDGDNTASVVLGDGQGREHIRLTVEDSGAPRIELLDAERNVIQRLPG